MKHILLLVSIALPLVCVEGAAMAFAPGVPPLSGPGSVFHGNPAYDGPTQKSQSTQKSKKPRFRVRRQSTTTRQK
jgi:hypothetical protein